MPDISVIVPSVNGLDDLIPCLRALEDQRKEVDLEAVVVDRLGPNVRQAVETGFPWAKVVPVAAGTTIPEMREIGVRASTAPAIGVIEDHVLVRSGWARAMLDALDAGADVVGGAVENGATDTVCDWAAFLCEYSHCLPPLPAGEADWLTGNNVVYNRSILDAHASVLGEHRWENRLHDAIRAAGTPLVCHPEIVVDHKKHFTLGSYVALRYQYSRSYAGMRSEGMSISRRLVYTVGSVALPPLLYYRTVRRILSKGRHKDWLLKGLPYLGVFVVAWAWGEMVGYLAGGGDSLSKVT